VANLGPASGSPGHTSYYWNRETKWYPSGEPENLFSLFMHTGQVGKTPIFVQPNPSVRNARGEFMGQAYGFGYDESPGPVPGVASQPPVPSEFSSMPAGTTSATITLGPWE
jgi:hypothetical protein